MCYIIIAVIISDADKIQFDGERQENQKFILYNAWKMVKLIKQVRMVKLTKTVELIRMVKTRSRMTNRPQSIYLARQGLVATLVVARHAPTFPLSKISGNKSSLLEVSGVSHLSFQVKAWEITWRGLRLWFSWSCHHLFRIGEDENHFDLKLSPLFWEVAKMKTTLTTP